MSGGGNRLSASGAVRTTQNMQRVQPDMHSAETARRLDTARVNELTTVTQEDDHSGRQFIGEIQTKYTYIADSNTPSTVKLTIRDTSHNRDVR